MTRLELADAAWPGRQDPLDAVLDRRPPSRDFSRRRHGEDLAVGRLDLLIASQSSVVVFLNTCT